MTLVSRGSSFSYHSKENCFSTNSHSSYNSSIMFYLNISLPCGSKNFILKFDLLPMFLLSIAALAAANLLLLKLFFSILYAATLVLGMAMSYKRFKEKVK